ncbi:ankyrin repeat protein [Pelomyxa schiedti]|nr:ankyrin repeat protein [Pelomyxa schiedti]
MSATTPTSSSRVARFLLRRTSSDNSNNTSSPTMRKGTESKLHEAIKKGDLVGVRARLSKHSAKTEVLAPDSNDQIPIVAAMQANQPAIVEELLKFYLHNRIDINLQDRRGCSVLHHAVQYCDEQILLKILNTEGIQVSILNQDLNTPLHYFCEKFRSPQCQEPFNKMIEKRADVNAVNRFGETPLHKSCFNKSVRLMLVTMLLDAGADVNSVNSFGEGPLHFAVRMNRDDLVMVLLKAGAHTNVKGKEGKTPLELALSAKNIGIANRLQKVEDLYRWLESVDPDIYTLYKKKFLSESLFLDVIPMVDQALLQSIGVDKPAHRLLILSKAEKLKAEQALQAQQQAQAQVHAQAPVQQAPPVSHVPHPPVESDPSSFKSSKSHALLTKISMANLNASTNPTGTKSWIIDSSEFEYYAQVGKSGRDKIGSGTSGKVYKALYKGNDVAVKVLKPWEDETEADEFQKEFEIMCVLHHPNIVTFFGSSLEPKLCMIMEFCSRGTLYDVLNNTSYDIGWDKVFKFCIEMTQGLNCLHTFSPSILHRDFKSLNVLVTEKWDCKVCDFGLSRFNTTGNQLATLREMRGTFPYCAPELGPDAEHPSKPPAMFSTKCDVYSLGITFWEVFRRCIDGVYSKPWYSEFSFPANMDFVIVIEAQKGIRPTLTPPDVSSTSTEPPAPSPTTPPPTSTTTSSATATTPDSTTTAATSPYCSLPHSTPQPGRCPECLVQLYKDCVSGDPEQRPPTHILAPRLKEIKAFWEQHQEQWTGYCKPAPTVVSSNS